MLADIIMKGWTNSSKKGNPSFVLDLKCIDTEQIDTVVNSIDMANQFGDSIHWTITINHEFL